jgi:hypothetical protein
MSDVDEQSALVEDRVPLGWFGKHAVSISQRRLKQISGIAGFSRRSRRCNGPMLHRLRLNARQQVGAADRGNQVGRPTLPRACLA